MNLKKEISDILKQVHPDKKISQDAIEYIHQLISKLQEIYSVQLNCKFKDFPRDDNLIEQLLHNSMPDNLDKHAISEAKKRRTLLPVDIITKYFSNSNDDFNLALTSSIEYILAEVLELAGNAEKKTIIPKNLNKAIISDDALLQLLGKCTCIKDHLQPVPKPHPLYCSSPLKSDISKICNAKLKPGDKYCGRHSSLLFHWDMKDKVDNITKEFYELQDN